MKEGYPFFTVEMESGGRICMRLHPEKAPNAVNSILEMVDMGAYDGLQIQRIAPDFVLQPWYDEKRMDERFHYVMKGEFEGNGYQNDLPLKKYAVGMAGDGNRISSCGCFFIVAGEDCGERLYGKFTAVGEVIDGADEVERIMHVATREVESGMPGVEVREPVLPEMIRKASYECNGFVPQKPEKWLEEF